MTYSPSYNGTTPLTDFASVRPKTSLSSLNLNWREQDLPEHVRTKHVHRLHPYLGKFIPQLAEIFLRKFQPTLVCDPFCGSGTTMVEANALGINAIGSDISRFNCLLTSVKTASYDTAALKTTVSTVLADVNVGWMLRGTKPVETQSDYLRSWFHEKALSQLLCYRSRIPDGEYRDLLRVVLSRSARSARLTTHFDLDWPKKPQTEPYHCYKHDRICKPTDDSLQFLNRYSIDAVKRVAAFQEVRGEAKASVLWGDARSLDFPSGIDLVVTSPPYVGIIDYHEQHRYAYELLELPSQADSEIGPAFRGTSKKAQREYIEQIEQVFSNLRRSLATNAVVVVIVNDSRKLYDDLPERLGFKLEERLERHVNRRTGRRSGDFYESIFVWRKASNGRPKSNEVGDSICHQVHDGQSDKQGHDERPVPRRISPRRKTALRCTGSR